MKLLRYSEGDQTRLGALEGETIVDLSPIASDYPTILSIVRGGDAALARVQDTIAAREHTRASAGVRLLAPIERPGKFLAIGMNYRKHMAESEKLGVPKPQQQFWFNKQTTCIAGPFDDVVAGVTEKLDYEVELAAIIGAHEQPRLRIFGADHVDDPVGDLALLGADRDDLCPLYAGGAQHVEPRAVAEIDTETEGGGLPDTVG